MLYSDPLGADARLSPAYDIVNTTAYIPEDSLALTLAGSKSLFQSRLGIMDLAQVCGVHRPQQRLRALIEAVEASLQANEELADEAPKVFAAIRYASQLYRNSFIR